MTLFAFRKGKEPKHILAEKGVKEKDAYEKAFAALSKDGKTVTYDVRGGARWAVCGGVSVLVRSLTTQCRAQSFKEFANMGMWPFFLFWSGVTRPDAAAQPTCPT